MIAGCPPLRVSGMPIRRERRTFAAETPKNRSRDKPPKFAIPHCSLLSICSQGNAAERNVLVMRATGARVKMYSGESTNARQRFWASAAVRNHRVAAAGSCGTVFLVNLRRPRNTATTELTGTGTVCPSFTRISTKTPQVGDGISASTLSVEISKSGSSRSTSSPTRLNQRTIVPSATDSPIGGITTSVETGSALTNKEAGQVKQGEQEVLHVRSSVGQTSRATQCCLNPGFQRENWDFEAHRCVRADRHQRADTGAGVN
jgi:hypothetical protein